MVVVGKGVMLGVQVPGSHCDGAGGRQAGAPQPGALTPSVWTASVVADVTAAAAAGAVGLRDVTGAPPCLGSLSVQQG